MSVLLVGELNPYGDDPAYALWDEPAGASGANLRRILGLRSSTYRALNRTNLCRGKWSLREARRRADLMDGAHAYQARWHAVVMLGRRVATAFGWSDAPLFSVPVGRGQDIITYVLLPHPSGRCRAWNEPDAVGLARDLLRTNVPTVPWGEEP